MDQNQGHIKTVVVGDSGVGKSSILVRFVNDQFNEFHQPTLGAAYVSKLHYYGKEKSKKFQIWDTAGQEKFKSIAPIYYRETQAALCVYDISNKRSFQVMKKWIEQLRTKGPQNLQLAVVGNKIDKIDEQQVSYQEAKAYAEEIQAIFKFTSAKQNKGIKQLFTEIALKFQKNNPQQQNYRESIILHHQKGKNINKNKTGCCG